VIGTDSIGYLFLDSDKVHISTLYKKLFSNVKWH
jgi:hypothetical protein